MAGFSGDGKTCKLLLAEFEPVYTKVFVGNGCSGCHGMFGDAEATYNWLTTASLCGGSAVVAGSASQSRILNKVLASLPLGSCGGGKMPAGSSGLTGESANLLQSWIIGGAKP